MATPDAACTISHSSTFQVFKDPFHAEPQCRFDVQTAAAAYVEASDVVASDKYVVYVTSSGANHRCVFLTPNNAGAGCNLATAPGVNAPGGTLALTWPLNTSLEAGRYTIALYDQTAGRRLGTVQVSLTQ